MRKSIIQRLLLTFVFSLAVTMSAILFISDRRLRVIIDESQNQLYRDKLDMIWLELMIDESRLEITGLREAYEKDFQNSALKELRNTFYRDILKGIYPFIIDTDQNILLHPNLSGTKASEELMSQIGRVLENSSGDFNASYEGIEKWYVYKRFEPWDWVICYGVPLREKYGDLYSFRQIQIAIVLIFSCILIFLITLLLIRILKPVKELTAASIAMAEGEWSPGISINRQDELGILAGSFNAMQNSIHEKMEDLTRARSFISDIIDSMPSAIISLDSLGRITMMNETARELLNTHGDIPDETLLWEAFSVFEGERNTIIKSLTENIIQEISSIQFKGPSSYYETVIYPLENSSGAVLRIDDVSQKKKMEEQMTQFQKMDALGQLVGGVAHDFNNMLGGVIAAADLLKSGLSENDQNRQLVDLILDASGRASDLVSNLMSFSRKTVKEFEPADLHSIIYRTVSILKRTLDRKIGISIVDEAEHTVFSGAEAKIENLIMNMAINASHAMPTGGLLTIRTKNTFLDEYYCSQSPFNIKAGRYIEMQIRDTGSGIDPEILDRIFEPFFTTKKTGKGTGLGLSSVFGTVQEHNGAISVYSEPGTGTVFHVYLPCEEKEMENNSETRDLTWSGDAVVLLVDDEEIIRKTATMILNEMGMTVLTAVDGMDALKVFRDNNIDLVITDMIMPRMGGRELVCELRKLSPGLKIVVSSGFTKEDDLEELKHQGINSFIQKPFTMDELALLMKDIFS